MNIKTLIELLLKADSYIDICVDDGYKIYACNQVSKLRGATETETQWLCFYSSDFLGVVKVWQMLSILSEAKENDTIYIHDGMNKIVIIGAEVIENRFIIYA